jgi:hypothetical protein
MTDCCTAPLWRNRCTNCGHRKAVNGVPPIQTRDIAKRRPWFVFVEIAGRMRARQASGI